jgi:uncharacterized caspase-like protein
VIDRRAAVLGGLCALVAPALASAQRGGGPGPAPGPAPGGSAGVPGDPGATGSRIGEPAAMRAQQQAQTQAGPLLPQPARIAALVLSQSYQSTPQFALANTARDAELIARSFQRLRFDSVAVQSDGTPEEVLARILAYLAGVDPNTIALVYLAGHGVEIAGENLLLLNGGATFLSLQALVQALQQRAGVAILFVDACRNNPLASLAPRPHQVARAVSLAPEGAVRLETVALDEFRSAYADTLGRLHAFSVQGSGIKIVFSTDPANVALDGARPDSRNSPFAQALARHIREPVSLDDIVSLTTGDVIRATHRLQSPWSQGSIDRPIFLSGPRRRRQGGFG